MKTKQKPQAKSKASAKPRLTKKSFQATLERLRSNLGWVIVWIPFDVHNSNHWIAFHLIGAFPGSQKPNSPTSPTTAAPQESPRANSFASSTSSTSSTSFFSSRDALGARTTVKTGSRIFVDEVRSGSSYDSNSDMRVHFGLGSIAKVDSIEIRWPSGLVEHFDNLAVDKIHTVKEGSGTAAKASM